MTAKELNELLRSAIMERRVEDVKRLLEKENGYRIADAMNTYNVALNIIKEKGYKIFLYPDEREEFLGDFWAIKGSREFIGSDPLRLLGVISIWENTGDNILISHRWNGFILLYKNEIDKLLK